MNDFVRCNKLTGVYWLQGSVDKLKIKIQVKPPDQIMLLPNLEDFTNETGNISLEQNIKEFSFKWQEKSFSECEVQRYKDVHNCLTENELRYHEQVKTKEIMSSKIFTYIHEDYYMPLPEHKRKNVSLLCSCLERLNLYLYSIVGSMGYAIHENHTWERHLFKSEEDIAVEEERWTAMHVMLDHSDYNEDTVLVKQEATLLSLFHNTTHNYIILSPDVSELETNPYVVEASRERLPYQYGVGVQFGAEGGTTELETLLMKLHEKWQKRHRQLVTLATPPLQTKHLYFTIEIISAQGFCADNLYIEYHIKTPARLQSREATRGRTHVARACEIDGSGARVALYGHLVELCLEIDSGSELGASEQLELELGLEVISRDVWRRHRTCGYARLAVPLAGGARRRRLRCVRPAGGSGAGAEEGSYFLGGCHLLPEPGVRPALQSGAYTYTETGTVSLRTSVVVQRSLRRAGAGAGAGGEPGSVLRGAEAALRRYRQARARLAQAQAQEPPPP